MADPPISMRRTTLELFASMASPEDAFRMEQFCAEEASDLWHYCAMVLNMRSCPQDPYQDFHQIAADRFHPATPEDQPPSTEGHTLIQCRKCKGKVEWYEKQTRSADEAMTQFCTCLECGFKWRQ